MNVKTNRATLQKRRKKRRPIEPSSKRIYREHKLMERLLSRYTDREGVLNVMDANSVEEIPNEFFSKADGVTACHIRVDWLSIRDSLVNTVRHLAQFTGRSSQLTPEQLERATKVAVTSAVFYMLEFMPEAFDLALSRLCFEALVAKSVPLDRDWIKSVVESLAKMDYEAMLRRLEVHEGPRPKFRHRSQYERALKKTIRELVADGERVTQGSVAGRLGKDKEDSIDERVIRRWNAEFGVNWKGLVREASKPDKS